MRIGEIIEKKKRGQALSEDEIHFVVEGYVAGELPDYQISALLMSIWYSGMTPEETTNLTVAMAESGDQVDLSGVTGITVDKHSTGGVADSTTLIVAPIVAACGGRIAKMSGRGLGHTGGTLDKLESIPGMRVDLSPDDFIDTVNNCGLSVVGQTGNLVPADKKLYALRDVTATVDSVPLIASSIMSKKLAAGASCIVLDVKWGTGAFMKSREAASELARTMVDIGTRAQRNTVALVTDMNQPLGRAVGNALDVAEAIRVVRGEEKGDLYTVSLALAAELLLLSDICRDAKEAREASSAAISSGAAAEKLACMIEAQHGNPRVVEDTDLLPAARERVAVTAAESGFVASVDAESIGTAAQMLGAGRTRKDDLVDPAVGVVVHKRLGDEVSRGEELATLYVNEREFATEAAARCLASFGINVTPPETHELICDRIHA